ncbi:hypothetical protein BDR06DRAFT_1009074 [Suillus hirtellus]|nr:hypothetical protein BDR06DRAFT_1009074 [Suillus hirtellus]
MENFFWVLSLEEGTGIPPVGNNSSGIELAVPEDEQPILIQIAGFPLRPLYATTLNGCQGLTLEKVEPNLRSHMDGYTPRIREYDVPETFERYFQQKKTTEATATSEGE